MFFVLFFINFDIIFINSDVTKVQNGIGDKVGMLIHSLAMFIASFVIGFVYSWRLTLVLLALTPLMIITTAVTGYVRISNLSSLHLFSHLMR